MKISNKEIGFDARKNTIYTNYEIHSKDRTIHVQWDQYRNFRMMNISFVPITAEKSQFLEA